MYTYIHKALYIVTNEFLGKLCLRFFIIETPLFTFEIALQYVV